MAKGTPAKVNRNKELVALKLSGKTFKELAKRYKLSIQGAKQIYYRDLPKFRPEIEKVLTR